MMVRRLSTAIAASAFALATPCALVAGASEAAAQTNKATEGTAVASPNDHLELGPQVMEGDRLRASGDLASALRLYRAAQTNQKTLAAQKRIAETEDQLGQYGVAYAEYAHLLDSYGSTLQPSEKRLIEMRLRELDELTGMLFIEGLGSDFNVKLDGRLVTATELERPLRVSRGMRRLEVTRSGFKPAILTPTVGPGLSRVTVEFDPLPSLGSVTVSASQNAPADLYVDDKPIGPLPQRLTLSVGSHVLYADGPTVYAPKVTVPVSTTAPANVTLTLIPKGATLEIDPVAMDAVLHLDHQAVGPGYRKLELAPGKHILELRRPGYKSQSLTLEARPGMRQSLKAGKYVADPQAAAAAPQAPSQKRAPSEPPKASPDADQGTPPSGGAAKAAPPREPESRFRGIYGAVFVPVMLGGDSTHSYVTQCPAAPYSGACNTTAPRGGGLALRLGYFYEWVGLEAFAAGAVDVSTAELKLPPIPTVSQQMMDIAGRNVFIRAGAVLGGGIRLSTPIQGIRLTLGANYVHVARKVYAIPDAFTGTSLSYSVPGYFLDAGIQLGSTPGARFYLGAFLFIERAHSLELTRNLAALGVDPSLIPAELTKMTVYQGRQYFFGPLLGIAFGH